MPSLQDVDLRLIRVFMAVAKNRGLSSAQQDLGVTQATISNQLSQLEQRLGVRLCERGRSGFSLTDEGRAVLDAAHNLFRSIDNFRSIVDAARGKLTGTVHFGTVDAMWSNPKISLHEAFRHFSENAPSVVIHTEIAAPQDLLQGLTEDRYQVVLAPIQQPNTKMRETLLFSERQSLYCGSKHPLFATPDTELAHSNLSHLAFAARTYDTDHTVHHAGGMKPSALSSHMESIALLIMSGQYVGFLPRHFAQQWVACGEMRELMGDKYAYDDTFYLISRKNERNRAANLMFESLKQQGVNAKPRESR